MSTDVTKNKLESIYEIMSNCQRNGRDCHEIDNIRLCAQMALELLDKGCGEIGSLLVERLERRTKEFFIKRYGRPKKDLL